MRARARPRYGLMLASLAVAALAVLTAFTISAWTLLVLPFAFIVGTCAFFGYAFLETWDAIGDASGDDVGRGPAGLGF